MFDLNTKILVVDDMAMMRKVVIKLLKAMGFSNITEATDGSLAWQAILSANPPFGLIISDWNMPNSTGLELLKHIRGDARYKTLPFVMVTAEAEQHQILEAVKAGVSSYIVKPFADEDFKQKLAAVYSKKVG